MDVKEFKERLESVSLGEVIIEEVKVPKNRCFRRGLIVRMFDGKLRFCAPTIYLDHRDEISEERFENLVHLIREPEPDKTGIEILQDYNSCREKICLCLADGAAPFLGEAVSRPFAGVLALYYRVRVELGGEKGSEDGSVVVNKRLLETWGVSENTLYQDAVRNLAVVCRPLVQQLCDMGMLPEDLTSEFMYPLVLTNQSGTFGASALASEKVLGDLYEKFGEFYVLPSSVHEVLIVPATENEDVASLQEMVRDVNEKILEAEEFLSNEVFRYDGEKLVVAS